MTRNPAQLSFVMTMQLDGALM